VKWFAVTYLLFTSAPRLLCAVSVITYIVNAVIEVEVYAIVMRYNWMVFSLTVIFKCLSFLSTDVARC